MIHNSDFKAPLLIVWCVIVRENERSLYLLDHMMDETLVAGRDATF